MHFAIMITRHYKQQIANPIFLIIVFIEYKFFNNLFNYKKSKGFSRNKSGWKFHWKVKALSFKKLQKISKKYIILFL